MGRKRGRRASSGSKRLKSPKRETTAADEKPDHKIDLKPTSKPKATIVPKKAAAKKVKKEVFGEAPAPPSAPSQVFPRRKSWSPPVDDSYWICWSCDELLENEAKYDHHCSQDHKHHCNKCDMRFTTEAGMLRHKFDKHGEKKQIYRCDICQELVDTKSRKSHNQRHGPSDLNCPSQGCTVRNNEKGIWVHKISKHEKEFGFLCLNPTPPASTELMETEVAKLEDPKFEKFPEETVDTIKDDNPGNFPNDTGRENFELKKFYTEEKEESLNDD